MRRELSTCLADVVAPQVSSGSPGL